MDANDVTKALKKMKKPRRGTLPAHSRIPLEGLARKKILKQYIDSLYELDEG